MSPPSNDGSGNLTPDRLPDQTSRTQRQTPYRLPPELSAGALGGWSHRRGYRESIRAGYSGNRSCRHRTPARFPSGFAWRALFQAFCSTSLEGKKSEGAPGAPTGRLVVSLAID